MAKFGRPAFTQLTITNHRLVWSRRIADIEVACGHIRWEWLESVEGTDAARHMPHVNAFFRVPRRSGGLSVCTLTMFAPRGQAEDLATAIEQVAATYFCRRMRSLRAPTDLIARADEKRSKALARTLESVLYAAPVNASWTIDDERKLAWRRGEPPDFAAGLDLADHPPWPTLPAFATDLSSTDDARLPTYQFQFGPWKCISLLDQTLSSGGAYPMMDENGLIKGTDMATFSLTSVDLYNVSRTSLDLSGTVSIDDRRILIEPRDWERPGTYFRTGFLGSGLAVASNMVSRRNAKLRMAGAQLRATSI